MRINIREKKIVFSLVVVIGLILVSSLLAMTNKGDIEVAAFEEVRSKKGDLKIDMVSDGVIELNTVNLQFEVNGVLAEILVNEGEKVEKGQNIAKLEDNKYKNDLDIAKANYLGAQAKLQKTIEQRNQQLLTDKLKLEKAKADLEKIKLQYLPMEKIPEAYSLAEIQTKKLDLENAAREYETGEESYLLLQENNADVQDAQATVEQFAANLKKTEENLSETALKSPLNGTVVKINGKVGEIVSTNNDGSKAFAIVSEDKVKAVAKVLELDIGDVSIGQKVEVVVEAFPDEKYVGEVSHIAFLPTIDNSGIVAYEVEVEFLEPNTNLRDGMTCTASFILKEVKDVVIIPNKAVKMVEGKQVVELLSEKGEKVQKEVKTGFTDGYNVEIKEGLQPGGKVLIYK